MSKGSWWAAEGCAAMVLSAVALGLAPGAAQAITSHAADGKALKATRTERKGRPTILFRAPGVLAGKTAIRDSGPDTHAKLVTRTPTQERAFVYYLDLKPHQRYAHDGRVVIVGQKTGSVRTTGKLHWQPIFGARRPVFLRSAHAYNSGRYRVVATTYRGTVAGPQRRSLGDGAFAATGPDGLRSAQSRSVASTQFAAQAACTVDVSNAFSKVSASGPFGAISSGLRRFRYLAGDGTLADFVHDEVVRDGGCRDVLIAVVGDGHPAGDPTARAGLAVDGSKLTPSLISAKALRSILNANQSATFSVVVDAPSAGGFVDALKSAANLRLVTTSTSVGQNAWRYLPTKRVGGKTVTNPAPRFSDAEFTNRVILGAANFLNSDAEVTGASCAPSLLAWMLARAYAISAPYDFTADLGATPRLFTQGFVASAPGTAGSCGTTPVNHAPTANSITVEAAEDTAKAVTLTGTDADGDALSYTVVDSPTHGTLTGAAPNLTYTPAANYTGDDSFTFTTSDGSLTSDKATVTIHVAAVDDPPVATASGSVAYTENDPATTVAPALDLTDGDSTTLTGATAKITAGYQSGADVLALPAQPAITATFDAATGTLTLAGSASVTAYRDALRAVTYRNTGDDPGAATRTVSFSARDAGGFGPAATRSVTVTPINDPPSITTTAGPLAYTEGAAATAVDPGLIATDPDSQIVGATAQITGAYLSTEDVLAASPAAPITVSYDAATATLTFSGSASPAAYQAALRSVTYRNSSQNPDESERTVTFKMSDASGPSPAATRDIDVSRTDTAPTVTTTSGALAYTENDAATAIDSALTVTDPDSANLTGATVALTAGYVEGEDILALPAQPTITGSFNATTGILTLTGTDTVLAYRDALRAVTYVNTSDDPTTAARTVSFTASDATGAGAPATRGIAVTAVDDPPVAEDDTVTVDEDGQAPLAVLSNDTDVDAGPKTATVTDDVDNGTLVLNANGTGTYTPAANYCGADSFTYQLAPGGSEATVSIAVVCVDDPPVAVDDSKTVNEDSGFTAIDVLANDTDIDAGPKTIVSVNEANAHGSVAITGAGTGVNYRPEADYCGPANFSYTLNGGSTAVVTVTVTCVDDPPVAVNDSTTVNEDSGATAIDVLANDTDVDAGPKSITSVDTTGSHGSVVITGGGTGLTYSPDANFCGTDSFKYTLTPGGSIGTVSVTVTCVDDAPVAVDDTPTVSEDSGATAIDVLANDTDVDAGPKTVASVTQPTNGAVVRKFDGSGLTYTPNANFCGTDTFTYTLNGGSVGNVSVSVTCVDDPPVAVADSVTVGEDSGLTSIDVRANDTDIDGGPKQITNRTNPAHGTASSGGLLINYTPNADYCGTDTFQYQLNGGSAANVTITVTCVNDAPVVDLNGAAAGTSTTANFNELGSGTVVAPNTTVTDVDDTNIESATVTLTNRLDGDSAETLTATTTGTNITANYTAATGVLALTGSDTKANYQSVVRSVTYKDTATPASGGDRTITFTVNDGDLDSATATATLTVIPADLPPVLDLDSTTLGFDSTAAFTEDQSPALLAPNATVADLDDTDLESAVIVITNPTDGATETLAANAGATGIIVTYFPATHALVLAGHHTLADYETVLRTVTFSDSSNTPGTTNRQVTFTVNDGAQDSNSATATVSVTPANDAPTATDQSLSTGEDTALPITLSGTDPESDSLTFTHDATSDQGGTISGSGASVTYTPPADFCGDDDFGFSVDDGHGGIDAGTISISVSCTNDPPVLASTGPATAAFTEDGSAVAVGPLITVTDVDNANLVSAVVTLTNTPDGAAESLTADTSGTSITPSISGGVVTLTGSDTQAHYQQVLRSVAYNNTSNTPDTTDRTVTFVVNDGAANSNTLSRTVTVTPANDPPVVDLNGTGTAGVNTTASFTEDAGAVTLAPSTDVSDPDNINLASATVTLTNRPDGALESLQADTTGTLIVATAYNAATGVLSLSGSDTLAAYRQVLRTVKYNNTDQDPDATARSITFSASDGSANSPVATATATVIPVNDPPVVDLDNTTGGTGSSAAFVEDSPAVAIGPNAAVTDPDDTSLASLTVTLTNHPDGAAESLSATASGGITVSSYNATTGVLTLTGPATPAQFQTVLRTVKYNNTSNTPNTANRDVTVTANDGDVDSSAAHATVSVTPNNDAPVAGDESFTGAQRAVGNTSLVVDDPSDGAPDPTGPQKTVTGDILSNDTDPDGPGPLVVVVPGGGTITTADGGTVTIEADGDFTYLPNPATDCTDHSDSFDYTVNDQDPTNPKTDTGTVTIAIADCVWYVDASASAPPAGTAGTSQTPLNSLAGVNGAGGSGDKDASGDYLFLYAGTYSGGLPLETNQTLRTKTVGLTVSDGAAGTTTLETPGAGTSTLQGGLVLADGTNSQGVILGTTAGAALTGTLASGQTATISNSSINNASNAGVSVSGAGTLNATFSSVTAGGGTSGIAITNTNGTFSGGTGTLSGSSGPELDINGGSGSFTYDGVIGNGTGLSARVQNRTGGSVTATGNITDTNDSGGGISLAGNTGGTTTFSGSTKTINTNSSGDGVVMSGSGTLNLTSGGLAVATGTGKGLEATGGTVTVTGSGNTIDTTTGTALNLTNATIGNNDLTFQKIASNGAVNGIKLDTTTNAAGALNVTGNGGTCDSAANCTGGAIQSSTGTGVLLSNVPGGVSFTRLAVTSSADFGIHADTAAGIAVDNSAILNSGNATAENGVDYTNVSGVTSITGSDVTGSRAFNVHVANSTSIRLDLTLSDDDIKNSDPSLSGSGEDGVQLDATGNANMRSNITGNRFDDNKGDAFQATSSVAAPSAISDITFKGNTIDGRAGTNTDGGVVVGPDGTVRADISNNTITTPSVSAIIINPNPVSTSSASFDAKVDGNTIGSNGVADSGSVDGDGIQVKSASDGLNKIAVTNNVIRNFDEFGMLLRASEAVQTGGRTTQLTATGNQISQPDAANSVAAIYLQAGSSSVNDNLVMCADVGGAGALANTFSGTLGPDNFGGSFVLDLRFPNSVMRVPGYSGTTVSDRSAYFTGRNSGFSFVQDGTQNLVNNGGACLQPTAPTLPIAP